MINDRRFARMNERLDFALMIRHASLSMRFTAMTHNDHVLASINFGYLFMQTFALLKQSSWRDPCRQLFLHYRLFIRECI